MTALKNKPKAAKKLPTLIEAVQDIMLTATGALTLKQIAKKAKSKTKKEDVSEASVSARLRDLRKVSGGTAFDIVRSTTAQKGVFGYTLVVKRANDEVRTPDGVVKANTLPTGKSATGPKNPIVYGKTGGNVSAADQAKQDAPAAPVAGSRSAASFVDTLKTGTATG